MSAGTDSQEDVRRIAMRLPGVVENPERFAFSVPAKGKATGFVWVWLERIDPKKGRVPNPCVLGIAVKNLGTKEMILGSDSRKFFTEPHYNGYPAILVRLAEIDEDELEDLIIEAWRCKAPKALADQLETA